MNVIKKCHFDLKFNIKVSDFFSKAKNKYCKPTFLFIPFNAQLSFLSVTHGINFVFLFMTLWFVLTK